MMSNSRALTWIAWLIWGLILWGALQIQYLPVGKQYSVCGPWGCGPTVKVLLTCHLGWLVLLSPLAVIVPRLLTPRMSRITGWTLVVTVAISVVAIITYEWITWGQLVSDLQRSYFGQRVLFTIATLTDVPILQTGLLGIVFWRGGNHARNEIGEAPCGDDKKELGEPPGDML